MKVVLCCLDGENLVSNRKNPVFVTATNCKCTTKLRSQHFAVLFLQDANHSSSMNTKMLCQGLVLKRCGGSVVAPLGVAIPLVQSGCKSCDSHTTPLHHSLLAVVSQEGNCRPGLSHTDDEDHCAGALLL